ncbi:hypothetical protein EVAR_54503_1 [Eumeta japonica]|uniref:Uncharacterized protein n=1 Tax=Eumeta variegata TaxID=151549 RepID=A0A4C1YK25_EUMVA|nr:hypothetical protein EVAR_54503_1 [Eumeta japonica]
MLSGENSIYTLKVPHLNDEKRRATDTPSSTSLSPVSWRTRYRNSSEDYLPPAIPTASFVSTDRAVDHDPDVGSAFDLGRDHARDSNSNIVHLSTVHF